MKKIILLAILAACLITGIRFIFTVSMAVKNESKKELRVKAEAAGTSGVLFKRKAAWTRLTAQVARELKGFSGVTGVVIKDLDTGWEISANKNLSIPSASMVKIPIMLACFSAAYEKRISLGSAISIRNSEKAPGSGTLKLEMPGKEFTVEDLIKRMIAESDNTAANMLINYLGFDALNRYFSKLGFKHTDLVRKMMDFKGRKEGVENYTTAGDIANILEKLYRGKFLSAAISKQCIDIMARQKVNDRIPKKLPAGVTVAHKTGLENGLCHDAGIVYTDKGDFLICVLTKHKNKNAREAKALIAEVSLLVYNYFGDF